MATSPAVDQINTSSSTADSAIHTHRWRLLGLVLLLLLLPSMLEAGIRVGHYSERATGGSFVAINFPGPKVWVMPTLQRSFGYRPGPLGASIAANMLINLVAVWLITTPMAKQPSMLRATTRWSAVAGIGVLTGLLLHQQSIRTDWSNYSMPYLLASIVIEAWCTLLLYFTLADYARTLQQKVLAKQLRIVAIAATIIILLGLPPAYLHEFFAKQTHDLSVQTWGAIYGLLSVATAAYAVAIIAKLLFFQWRFAFPNGLSWIRKKEQTLAAQPICAACGYDLRGLQSGGTCPECGSKEVVNATLEDTQRRETYWCRFVVFGLIGWLIVTPTLVYTILYMNFRPGLGGTLPLLNFPGPKVWAVPFLQRSMGYSPKELGTTAVYMGLINLLFVWLITWPHPARSLSEPTLTWRRIARWTAVIGAGAVFGLMLVSRNLSMHDGGLWKWITVSIAFAEGPGTVLIYLYLGKLAAERLGERMQSHLRAVTIGIGCLMFIGLMMLPIESKIAAQYNQWWVWLFFGAYGAGAVATALVAVSIIFKLLANLLPVAAGQIPVLRLLFDRTESTNRPADQSLS